MQSLKSHPRLLFSHLFSSGNTLRSFLFQFSTASPSNQCELSFVTDYLNANFNFSRTQSIYISKRVSTVKAPQKSLSVLTFFKQIGLSEPQIYAAIVQKPQILFSDVDKTLRPKVELFRRSGFEGSELCKFISKNSTLLTSSLEKSLVPSVELIRKIVSNHNDFLDVLRRCGWILPKYRKFRDNVVFLESCGIVGPQLSMLLKRLSRLFIASQSTIRTHVTRAVDMGFNEKSKMLIHGVHTICALSHETFGRKLELISSYGFSKDETLQMFRRGPVLLRTSEEKLKFGMEFFLHKVMLPKSALVQRPTILMYSMENRVIPRYRVLQLLISKKLCKKVPSYVQVLCLSEEKFLRKCILRFEENSEELLVAYKGHYLEA